MVNSSYDLVVVGGGPGGYVTAIRAAQLGMNTAIVEREHLGGICLNWGCIPTKALLRSSEIYQLLHRLDEFGFSAENINFDTSKIIARSRKIADQLSKGVAHLLKKNKVSVFEGHGHLVDDHGVLVEKDGKDIAALKAAHVILATGARAKELPALKADGNLIWTYKEAMLPDKIPESLIVIGSGAIGIEFASFYQQLGSDVTVVEILEHVLPVEDEEISDLIQKALEKQGIHFLTSATVVSLDRGKESVKAKIKLADGKLKTITADRVISAVGIVGNVENIGLESCGVKIEKEHIVTDKWSETTVPCVYAIGDVAGPPWLAHKAMHEGIVCVEHIIGLEGVKPLEGSNIPSCTYCFPQVASIGLTERNAKEAGHDVKIGRFPFRGNGKALALGEDEGLIKTVFDKSTGELLGAHMVGAEVTELIQGYAIAKTLETTELDLMHTIFPHPTLSEMMHESVLDAFGRTLHY